MLIRFEVSNFRSILDPVELSLVAVDTDRIEARGAPNLGESLLPVAAVYGPNASGKSNVLIALNWLLRAVRLSLRFWDDGIPTLPFAFVDGPDRRTDFTIEFLVAGVRFEYQVELDRSAVHYEGLFHYPERRRKKVFERDGDKLTLQRGLGNLSGTRELLTPRSLALSIARRFDEPLVSDFADTLLASRFLGPRPFGRDTATHTTRLFDEFPDGEQLMLAGFDDLGESQARREEALTLLRMADLGIEDVVVDRPRAATDDAGGRRRVRLVHRAGDNRVPLDFADESEGTKTWFALVGPVLEALRTGSLLVFDELDASLHPTLSAQLVRLFHDPATNPAGAQLVFTSHDTSLLNHLNRDEVWLTEKTPQGSTRLGALADFAGERVRRSQNLERAYLHGRFGALPDVDRTEVLRVLGLIG
ncbi:ATP-binding protein [Actinokineospora sp. PR83]|uniref:AAA family ATPase n=1 Tax=Actinokineospora sp. PR83 TaxID=2884908 RepID=UPI0027DEB93A|nr:AAA family ATPase [Actinokineospora sp. PR83]MCG8915065.1 ATP-binding protein [Actinokineospora sp. PR83]